MLPQPKVKDKDLAEFDNAIFHAKTIISGITINAQKAKPGDLFIALAGGKTHGINFADQAIANGAVAVLTDAPINLSVPSFVARNPRALVGQISAWFYEMPFSKLTAIGVTGTNGKTTTVNLVKQIWQTSGYATGVIGTIGTEIGSNAYAGERTTPEASELQSIAAVMVENKVSHLAIEVSSHALVQSRVTGAHFKVAAFSNLTQDHLDYHQSMENYFAAKAQLFTKEFSDLAVINIDDPYGDKLVKLIDIGAITVSRESEKGDWHYRNVKAIDGGFAVEIINKAGTKINANFNILGEHNLDNLILAVAIAVASGVSIDQIEQAIPKLHSVPGRLEKVEAGQSFSALVDYAHTPDAVERVLSSVKQFTSGRVIAILGCGGDRDRSKRSVMGQALDKYADISIFTSDNPRSEEPADILNEMVGNLKVNEPSRVIIDRREAISYAASIAGPGDTLILLGKGHEIGQEIKTVVTPFDDRMELAKAIKEMLKK
jgi:UDP-N-acetylmuramoyl-L-alanyl-D-glutamate--2,6-diaminopimelate ligase